MSAPTTAQQDHLLVVQARSRRSVRWAGQTVAVIAAIVELIVPVAIASGVARVLDGAPVGMGVLVPMLAAIIGAGAFAAAQVVLLTRIAASEMHRLRLTVAARLVGLRPRTVEKLGVGEATALYSHYANELEPLLTADAIRRRTAVITVVGCLVLMVGFEWRLTLALLVALIVAGLIIGIVIKPVKERAAFGLNALAETAADIGEYLRSIRSATVYGLGASYRREFETRLAEVAVTERRVGHAQALVDLIVKTTSMLLLVALGALGMLLVSIDAMSVANLSGFLGALAILLAPAAKYAELIQQVRTAQAAQSRIEQLPSEAEPSSSAPVPAPTINRLEVTDAILEPADGAVVGPVSFSARAGDLVCLVGPSGAGKTTLLSAIAGFAPVTAGQMHIGGKDLPHWSPPELWRSIAYVEQGTPTLGATVRTFLTPDEANPPDETTLRTLLTAFNLDDRLGADGIESPLERAGTSLSGGERQRLSIVRALASDRPLLLLDEPTAHLDSHTETAVLEAIDQLRKDRLVIAATHSERLIQRADQVVQLDPGVTANRPTSDLDTNVAELLAATRPVTP
ncbi:MULTISPECIES: ATP-binding cassette domain-containing protein [Micrococcales]|uniref:ABC-type multidrug transport system, ATPase and permease component n=3 Tax=Brevibacterium TaxID=1696 RepID=A0A2H1KBZ5_BRELN|nr:MULTISPECIES: ABC transporter ATP-binding protein [Brevibacterium]KAB1943094.1 ABC transporter ATP-binding protein [Brevibacterium linens ATCC 9172]TGD11620.1 ABC transporter ATP-binding protein [Brevibacterium sp. S111]SMX92508.1 ABC-type multidrug transport system, ATPase and permease component [Brevibacterium antiquum]SMX97273.1 ABC-type multidrug transport system, ATPase and permease component [Brevibacterium linens]SMY01426.1 ABC-type multidrug transport system, ATPase and permease com